MTTLLAPQVLLQGVLVLMIVGSLVYLLYIRRKQHPMEASIDMCGFLMRTAKAIDDTAHFLREEEKQPSIVFHHQELTYVMSYDEERKSISLFMPQIYEATTGEISLIRSAINMVNQESCNAHLVYTCDEQEGTIYVHIQVCLGYITNQEALSVALRDEMETMARLSLRFFNQIRVWHILGQQFVTDDCERFVLERNFEKSLLSKEEARHLRPRREHVADNKHRIRLREWLVRLCDGGLKAMVQLDIVTEKGLERIDETKKIVDIDPLSILIERYHTKSLWIWNIIAKYSSLAIFFSVFYGIFQQLSKAASIKNIIPKNKASTVITYKLTTNDESLGQSVRTRLLCILEVYTIV